MFSRLPSSFFVVFLAVFTILFPGLTARYATPSSPVPSTAATAAPAPPPASGGSSDASSAAPEASSQSALSECEGRFAGPILRLFASSQATEPPHSWRIHTLPLDSGSWTSTSMPGTPTAVVVSANGTTMAWIGPDRAVWVGRGDGAGGARKLRIDGAAAKALALSPEGDSLAALDTGGALWLWQPLDREVPESIACGRPRSSGAAIAMSADRVACASADRDVHLVDYRSGVRRPGVRVLTGAMGPVRSLAFSPDGTSLAVVAANGAPSVWRMDTERGRAAYEAAGSHYDAGPPAFSTDGRALAFAGSDGALWRWNLEASGSIPVRVADDASPSGPVAFAPGKERQLAYASAAGVTVLERESPKRTLATGRVLGLQFVDGGLRVEALPTAAAHDARFLRAARALASTSDRPGARFLLATVPDPIDSGEYAQADQVIESISQGIESSGPWLRDRFWLPWKDLRPRPAGEREPSEQCRAQAPGIVVFRSSDSSDPGQARALVLLLVGETPTWGVHKAALEEALDFIEAASGDSDRRGPHGLLPVDVVGPSFSGSAASIRSTLAAWTAARDGRQSDCFTFLSGSATADVNREQLDTCGGNEFESSADCADTCGAGAPPYMEFHATVLPDSVTTQRFVEYLHADAGAKCSQIAVLKESGTAYAADGKAVVADPEACPDLVTMRFPLHISAVRRAYDAAAQAGNAPPGSTPTTSSGMNLNPSLDEPADPLDVTPSLSPRTPFTNDLVLSALVRELSRRDVRFIGLQATDPSDVVFLAQQVRARMPDARFYVFGSDLLYTHPKFTPALLGAYVVSSYPLFLAGQAWVPEPLKDVSAFASDASEGVFNATRAFLNRDVSADRGSPSRGSEALPLIDYFDEEGRMGQLPSAWVSLVGLDGFLPVARIDPTDDTTGYVLDARRAPANITSAARIIQPDPKAPLEWWLAFGTAAALCASHAYGQWRGLRKLPKSLFELVGFIEPIDPSLTAPHHAHAAACSVALLAAAVPVGIVGLGTSGATWLHVAALVVIAMLAVLVCWHGREAARATRAALGAHPDAPVARALLRTASLSLPAVVWCLLAWVATIAIALPPHGTDRILWGALLRTRLSDLGSGLSPIVPLVAISTAAYAWHVSQVARIRARDLIREMLLAKVFANGEDKEVAQREALVRDALVSPAPPPAPRGAIVAAAIAIALFSAHWPSSLESARMVDVALRVALVAAAAGVTVSIATLLSYWQRLEGLLGRLANDPMVGAFDRLPKPFVRSLEDQIASALALTQGLPAMIRQLELLETNRVESVAPVWADQPLEVPWPQLEAAKEEASTGQDAPEIVRAADRVTASVLRQANVLRRYLSPAWKTRSLKTAAESLKGDADTALTKPTGTDAIPTTLALTNPSVAPASELWLRLAEEYVACVVTTILGHFVRHFRLLLGTVTSGVLLLMIAVSAYPLEPRRELMAGVWVLTLAAVSASAYTLFALERNDLLSRIGKKEPGKISLDRTFVTGLVMWALIPILGLLALQYPQIAGQLFSFLSPGSAKSS